MKRSKIHARGNINTHDLPEAQAQLVAAFVEFLRQRLRGSRKIQKVQEAETLEQDWSEGATRNFSKDWNNNQDAIYDDWKQHYHISER